MAAMQETERAVLDWEVEAIDLKRQGLATNEIADAVGKSAPTVRKAVAKARERGDLPEDTTDAPLAGPSEVQTTVGECDKCGRTAAVAYAPEYGANFCETCAADPQTGAQAEARDPLEDFRAEAGEAVGDMPPVTPPEPGETEHVLPVLAGTRQMALDFGPNAAPIVQSTVKFTSEKWPSGHFGAGDVVTGTFTARIVSVPHKEAFDKASEEFRAKPMVYGALITEIEYEAVDND